MQTESTSRRYSCRRYEIWLRLAAAAIGLAVALGWNIVSIGSLIWGVGALVLIWDAWRNWKVTVKSLTVQSTGLIVEVPGRLTTYLWEAITSIYLISYTAVGRGGTGGYSGPSPVRKKRWVIDVKDVGEVAFVGRKAPPSAENPRGIPEVCQEIARQAGLQWIPETTDVDLPVYAVPGMYARRMTT